MALKVPSGKVCTTIVNTTYNIRIILNNSEIIIHIPLVYI